MQTDPNKQEPSEDDMKRSTELNDSDDTARYESQLDHTSQLQRIREHQDRVSEVERANQQKSKELIARESILKEQEQILAQKLEAFEARQHARKMANQSKASLLAPIMLLTCIAAGYLAYEQIDQQRQYFQQVKAAEAHVDKLTRVLGLTAEKVKESKQEVATQDLELEQARARIQELEQQLALLLSETTGDIQAASDAESDSSSPSENNSDNADQGANLDIDQPESER